MWQAREYARDWETDKPAHFLNFLSIGVCMSDPGDIEYRYHVVCYGTSTIWGEEQDGAKVEIPEPKAAAVPA